MIRKLIVCLSLSLAMGPLTSCMAGSPPLISSAPGSQAGALEGRMILPYAVGDAKVSQGLGPLDHFLGEAANADTTVLITRGDLMSLRATLDDQPVTFAVRDIQIDGNQTVLSYRITGLPAFGSDQSCNVQILTRDGRPLLGGVVRFTLGQPYVYDFDVRSTAILAKVKEKHLDLKHMSVVQLRELEFDPVLITDMATLRTELQQRGTLAPQVILLADGDDNDHGAQGNKGHDQD